MQSVRGVIQHYPRTWSTWHLKAISRRLSARVALSLRIVSRHPNQRKLHITTRRCSRCSNRRRVRRSEPSLQRGSITQTAWAISVLIMSMGRRSATPCKQESVSTTALRVSTMILSLKDSKCRHTMQFVAVESLNFPRSKELLTVTSKQAKICAQQPRWTLTSKSRR